MAGWKPWTRETGLFSMKPAISFGDFPAMFDETRGYTDPSSQNHQPVQRLQFCDSVQAECQDPLQAFAVKVNGIHERGSHQC